MRHIVSRGTSGALEAVTLHSGRLACGGRDGTIHIWEGWTGEGEDSTTAGGLALGLRPLATAVEHGLRRLLREAHHACARRALVQQPARKFERRVAGALLSCAQGKEVPWNREVQNLTFPFSIQINWTMLKSQPLRTVYGRIAQTV